MKYFQALAIVPLLVVKSYIWKHPSTIGQASHVSIAPFEFFKKKVWNQNKLYNTNVSNNFSSRISTKKKKIVKMNENDPTH